MTITSSSFVVDFPEFNDTATYPDSGITYWINLAYLLMDPGRWGNLLDPGAEQFVAHNLVLEAQAQAASNNGATPGTSQGGVVSSKSAGGVSISYDTSSAIELDAGHWNMTIYGRRYIRLARMIGAGPVIIASPGASPLLGGSSGGWSGPDVYPGWLGS